MGRGTFHPLTVADGRAPHRRLGRVTFVVPDDLRDEFDFDAGQSLTLRRIIDGVEHRRSYSICAPAGAAPRIGVREIPEGLFSRWLIHDVKPGDVIEVQTPSGTFAADPATWPGGTCASRPAPASRRCSRSRRRCCATPTPQVTLLYGNRHTTPGDVRRGAGDLKNRYGPRLELVHVLSREPRDVELFSGRLDADRLRRLLSVLVPSADVDHVWLCGPFGLIADAREVLGELGVPADRVHFELFYVDEPPPELGSRAGRRG